MALTGIFGQAGFQAGYIIRLNGETIYGLIENTGEVRNSQICHFKAKEQSEAVEYLPGAITAYHFADYKFYESKTIILEGSEQLVFAECLVKGIASLYYYRSAGIERYFMDKEGSKMIALTMEKYKYISLLKTSFSDCREVQSAIDLVKLTHRSLKSITCKYNAYMDNGEQYITYEKGSRIKLRIGPSIGYASNNFSLKGQEPIMYSDFENSMDVQGGLLLDLSSSRLGNHLSLQVGSKLSKSSFHTHYETTPTIYSGRYTTYDVALQALPLNIFGGVKYSFTRARVRPGLGGGLQFYKYLRSDYRYIQQEHVFDLVSQEESVYEKNYYYDIPGNWFYGAYLQAGLDIDLTQRIKMFANITGGFAITNPKTFAALTAAMSDQFRVRSELISMGFNLGILF